MVPILPASQRNQARRAAGKSVAGATKRRTAMWGQKWGQLVWGHVASVPALRFWSVLILGALLGIVAVRCLRQPRPRRLGMFILALAMLIPISVRAVPFTFANGSVADATQVNADFAAVTLLTGSGVGFNPAPSAVATVFGAFLVAPRALTCVVHVSAQITTNTASPTGDASMSALKNENGLNSRPTDNLDAGFARAALGTNTWMVTNTGLFTVASGATVNFGCFVTTTGQFSTAFSALSCRVIYECQ